MKNEVLKLLGYEEYCLRCGDKIGLTNTLKLGVECCENSRCMDKTKMWGGIISEMPEYDKAYWG